MTAKRPQTIAPATNPSMRFDGYAMTVGVLEVARALASASRLRLLQGLGPEGRTVTSAAFEAGLSPSTASYHLHVLVKVGLARVRRRGRTRVYSWPEDRWEIVQRRAADQKPIATSSSSS